MQFFGGNFFVTDNPDIIHAEEEPDSLAGLQIALARRAFAPRATLILSTWQNIATNTLPASGTASITDPQAATLARRYYRALKGP